MKNLDLILKEIVAVKESEAPPPDALVKEEEENFTNYCQTNRIPDKKPIPSFYTRLPKENEPLRQKLREEGRSNLLSRKSLQLVDDSDLKEFWVLLEKNQTNPDEQLITYPDYLKTVSIVAPKIQPYLTSILFAKLQQGDSLGRISIMSLFNYVMKKVWLQQTRIGLSLYDSTGQGYLSQIELENYITDLIPSLPQLEGLEKSFHGFYVCTAVRKFFFFLDWIRAGRIRILDILVSPFLDDLLELRDESLSKETQEKNWFSAPSALHIYGQYLNLDRDHNGMLNKQEFAGYGTGTLTQPFLDRVFQTCLTYSGEIDYKTYLDLVLALENRSEPQAIAFLFRILDINNQGYLDAFTLNFFFRAIQEQMQIHGADAVSFKDVKDELFDMVKPVNPEKITLNDLTTCGQGDTLISILIEFRRFWAYENREAVTAEPTQN